jgi:hypothetical protein
MSETFLAYQRSGLFALAKGPAVAGRLQAALPVTLIDVNDASRTSPPGGAPFELLGPGDVRGLLSGAIIKRAPAPGASDSVETKAAQIEFAATDLPWRYSPELPNADGALRPWLVLVVGTRDEIVVRPDGTVQLLASVLAAHDLSKSYQWAHVHQIAGAPVSRLLSPRDCLAETNYVAALVPAFTLTGDDPAPVLSDAWVPGAASVVLRCYDYWFFRTGPEGDFAQIAARLAPVTAAQLGATFGVASVRYDWRAPANAARVPLAVLFAAALERTDSNANALPLDADLETETLALTAGARTFQGRWVLTAPRYEEPWTPPAVLAGAATGWRKELRADIRRRGAAGLGAWAGIEWQQKIAEAAAAQAGALAAAAQRIRHLTLGLTAVRSLWKRRFPVDPVARLALMGPLLGRLPAGGGRTALDQIDGRTPTFVRELFSSAMRRIARNGTARAALARPGAATLPALIEAANRCPPPQPRDKVLDRLQRGVVNPEDRQRAWRVVMADAERRARGDNTWLQFIPHWLRDGHALPPADVLLELLKALDPSNGRPPDVDALRALAPRLVRGEPQTDADLGALVTQLLGSEEREPADPPCAPLDLVELENRISAAVDPTVARPVAVERVLGTISGLREPVLAPPDLQPELDLPLWKFVSDYAPDWLLPGIGMLPTDRVVAVKTNPVFVEAFLVGANHQTLGELRWRNTPIMSGWSPLRRFWQHPVLPKPAPPPVDIVPVLSWPQMPALGDPSHRADPTGGENLVVVFRTELFRRYPATAVYLVSALAGAAPNWNVVPKPGDPGWKPIDPTFTGNIGKDVVFFGFPVTPAAAADHWLVLEEPPPGYRFYTEAPPPLDACQRQTFNAGAAAKNGAEFAAARFATPVRVFLGALLEHA